MNIGIIFAGGVGSRMHSREELPKQFLEMYNKPIIIHTLEHFENHPDVDAIVVVCITDWIPYLQDLLVKFSIKKVKGIVPGGDTGQLSIYNGLCAAESLANGVPSVVLIHDGVRPFINKDVLTSNILSVKQYGSAITTAIMKETVAIVNSQAQIDFVPDREFSRVAKAPQSFWLKDVIDSQRKAISENKINFIDTCSLMQYYGKTLHAIDGPEENMKITTPVDFYVMRAILEAKENAQIYGIF